MKETDEKKAERIKGYYSFKFKDKRNVQKTYRTADGYVVEPVVVSSLEEYIKEISLIHESDKTITASNPLFFHGHVNANFCLVPTVMRGSLKSESQLFNEFRRRFPGELKECRQTIEKLAFMQHYGLKTRCIDLTESPLVGLYFAVSDMVKFRTEVDKNRNEWGEVILVHLPDGQSDDIKYFDSRTASVISNIAQLNENFSLQQVQLGFMQDFQHTSLSDYIYFKDILRRSVIVRTKQDNPRIINQRGAFILVNANEITDIFDFNEYGRRNSIRAEEFSDYIYENPDEVGELNLWSLKNGLCGRYKTQFKNTTEWDFRFKKIEPYSLENRSLVMRNDPFDINRMLFRGKNGAQKVILVPPDKKMKIKDELAIMGITEEFIYPELDSVSNALNQMFI